jgi:hypothetical protein
LNIPATIPAKKQTVLEHLVHDLAQVQGVEAVVLGGSYARGTHQETSDLDVGLYYFENEPFSLDEIKRIATAISSQTPPVVTGFYEWGAWVNGGAWIQTEAGKVDFLYRNLDQVERTITEAQEGIVRHDYNQQPAYGFYSVIYLAETQICLPLYDPAGRIAGLKRQVEPYPARLKEKIAGDSLWSAEFTLLFARNFAAAADVYNTVGCLTRAAANLTQALFALNERYFISDKKVMAELALFPLLPEGYVQKLSGLLGHPDETAEGLSQTVAELEALWREVVSLAGSMYRPKFNL